MQGQKRMACVESSNSNLHVWQSAINAMQGIRRFSTIADISVQGATSRSLTGKSEIYIVDSPRHINAYHKKYVCEKSGISVSATHSFQVGGVVQSKSYARR